MKRKRILIAHFDWMQAAALAAAPMEEEHDVVTVEGCRSGRCLVARGLTEPRADDVPSSRRGRDPRARTVQSDGPSGHPGDLFVGSRSGDSTRSGSIPSAIVPTHSSSEELLTMVQRFVDHPVEMAAPLKKARPMTTSLGVAVFNPVCPESADALVQRADQALYRAKEAGRNQSIISTDPPSTEERCCA